MVGEREKSVGTLCDGAAGLNIEGHFLLCTSKWHNAHVKPWSKIFPKGWDSQMTHWRFGFSFYALETRRSKHSPWRIRVLNQPSPSNTQHIHVLVYNFILDSIDVKPSSEISRLVLSYSDGRESTYNSLDGKNSKTKPQNLLWLKLRKHSIILYK